jgi:hypothetical protein
LATSHFWLHEMNIRLQSACGDFTETFAQHQLKHKYNIVGHAHPMPLLVTIQSNKTNNVNEALELVERGQFKTSS